MSFNIRSSTHDFVRIRRDRLLYVDKTHRVRAFLEWDDALLITRPRRFGKSLLLSTIKAMYSGTKSLFGPHDSGQEELAVYRDPTWIWNKHIVLALDMSTLTADAAGINTELIARVNILAQDWGVSKGNLADSSPAAALTSLIHILYHNHPGSDQAGLVILVDEYDAPILNHLHAPQASLIRAQLASFYGVFKAESDRIKKLVLTGITRFVRDGLWSTLNHVMDVTQDPQFHDLVGFTDREMEHLWSQVMGRTATPLPRGRGIWPALSLEAWREWYDGYRFAESADNSIYNPFAIMRSLHVGYLRDFWAQSGHLGTVERLLQEPWNIAASSIPLTLYVTRPSPVWDYELDMNLLDALAPSESPAHVLRQWNTKQLTILLHQTGYLTLTPDGMLVTPNREIATHLATVMLKPRFQHDLRRTTRYVNAMNEALTALRFPDLIRTFNRLLHLFPHQRFRDAGEAPCNLLFDMSAMMFHVPLYHEMEKSGLQGDSDTVLAWNDIALVVEFRQGQDSSAQRGQNQIRRQQYLRSLNMHCRMYLGLSLYMEDRQVKRWSCEGYTVDGMPLHRSLQHDSEWPTDPDKLYARWGLDTTEGKDCAAQDRDYDPGR